MADDDDWRAERAAKLAGTPFERPTRGSTPTPSERSDTPAPRDRSDDAPIRSERSDDTLPIGLGQPVVPGLALAPPRPAARAPAVGRWLPLAGVAAALVAAAAWLFSGHEERAAPPVAVPTVAAPTVAAPPVAVTVPAAPRIPAADAPAPVTSAVPAPPLVAAAPTPASAPAGRDPTIVAIPAPKVRHAGVVEKVHDRPRHDAPVETARSLARVPSATHARSQVAVLPAITMPTPRCTPAAGRIAGLVCASPTLAALDREARELRAGVSADGDARLIDKADKGETAFLNRRERCKDAACLKQVYAHRIAALQKMRTKVATSRARTARRALPVCAKGQKPSPTTCRQRGLLKRLFGG